MKQWYALYVLLCSYSWRNSSGMDLETIKSQDKKSATDSNSKYILNTLQWLYLTLCWVQTENNLTNKLNTQFYKKLISDSFIKGCRVGNNQILIHFHSLVTNWLQQYHLFNWDKEKFPSTCIFQLQVITYSFYLIWTYISIGLILYILYDITRQW